MQPQIWAINGFSSTFQPSTRPLFIPIMLILSFEACAESFHWWTSLLRTCRTWPTRPAMAYIFFRFPCAHREAHIVKLNVGLPSYMILCHHLFRRAYAVSLQTKEVSLVHSLCKVYTYVSVLHGTFRFSFSSLKATLHEAYPFIFGRVCLRSLSNGPLKWLSESVHSLRHVPFHFWPGQS